MIKYIRIPAELYRLPIRGLYPMSILALIYNFNSKGLKVSNPNLAGILSVNQRTVERAISKLRKAGYIEDKGTGKNDRCLVITTDTLSVLSTDSLSKDTDTMSGGIPTKEGVSTDQTADHNRSKGKKNNESNNKYVENSVEFQLANLLLTKILERKPDYKKPNLQTWAKYIDQMIRLDKRTPERIRKVIEFCQQDSFWQNNILSTKKLREQFDRLEMQMNSKKGKQGPRRGADGLTARERNLRARNANNKKNRKENFAEQESQYGETIE